MSEKRLPLSYRLYQRQLQTQQELHALAHPPQASVNPLHLLDPVAWGESNFYIEDRVTLPTTGPIILSDHQKRIIRHATERILDPSYIIQRAGLSDDVLYNIRTSVLLVVVVVDGVYSKYILGPSTTTTTSRIGVLVPPGLGVDKVVTPTSRGIKSSDRTSVLVEKATTKSSRTDVPLHLVATNSTSTLVLNNHTLYIPDTLSRSMPSQSDCKALLLFLILAMLHPDEDITLPVPDVERYCQSLSSYSTIQKILHSLAPDSNFFAALHNVIVTSTRYRWSTVVYSCPKKSGKTRLSAMMCSWLASHSLPYSEIYCLANDGKQSADRVLSAVKKSAFLAKSEGAASEMAKWESVGMKVKLPGEQFIEAIPVDPTGEAGSQPTGTFWSEMWGFNLSAKEKLWTEMTIPPTRWGRALRWVESYAGFEGESPVLWQLYLQGVDQAEHPQGEAVRHPAFPDLPVYINDRANLFCYWDHEPRMTWQTPEYYAAQAATMPETEFRRVHRNEWVTPLEQAIPIDRWDQLAERLEPVGKMEPVILGVDLSVSGDYSALVVVSKHPQPKSGRSVAIRGVYVWEPQAGQKLDYSTTIMPAIRRWVRNADGTMNYNVICVTYDEYQAHLMSVELTNELGVWWEQFSQGKGTPEHPGRPVADKMFFDLVMSGQMSHDGNVVLRQHVHNAAARTSDEGRYMRFVKKREDAKIDALVAASMAVCMMSTLNV